MELEKSFQQLQSMDLRDLQNVGSSPLVVRAFLILLAMAGILAIGGWFLIVPQYEALQRSKDEHPELRTKFDAQYRQASSLAARRAQLTEMEQIFADMLRQLPDQIDIESLLIDLSQTSVAAGLNVEFFKPERETEEGFYITYPIRIEVTGTYHQFGNFVSGLATLPRIVTLSDIAMEPVNEEQTMLKMSLITTTYRYLNDGDK